MKEQQVVGATAVAWPGCDGAVLMYAEGGRCAHCGKSVVPCDQCPRAATRRYRIVAAGNRVRLEARCEEHMGGGRTQRFPRNANG